MIYLIYVIRLKAFIN